MSRIGQKAHVRDIVDHKDVDPEVAKLCHVIISQGWGSEVDFALIRAEWERLGCPERKVN